MQTQTIMTKMTNLIFGRVKKGEKPLSSCTTIHPPIILPFENWASEYRVGMLWDRKRVYIQ